MSAATPMGTLLVHEIMGIVRMWGLGAPEPQCFRAASDAMRHYFPEGSVDGILGSLKPDDFQGLVSLVKTLTEAASLLRALEPT